MAWEEDSITRLEQNLPTYNLTTTNDSSSISSDEEYEAFSLSDSRHASDKPTPNNNDERLPWWRFGAREPSVSDAICWGDDNSHDGSDDSSEERPAENAMMQIDEAEIRPSTWWQLSFRRGTVERRNSESTSGVKSVKNVDGGLQQEQQQQQQKSQPDNKDDELNRLLFPRRGRSRRPSQDSTLKGSVFRHDNSQSSRRSSLSNFQSHSSASIKSNRRSSEEEDEDVDQVVHQHSMSMNLTSIERALLADIVKPNENRWKKQAHNKLSSSIPEEDLDNSHSEGSHKEETVETTMETPISESHIRSFDAEESLSSEGVDEDGLYCTWSVPLDPPQDRHDNNNNSDDINSRNVSTLPLWDSQATLALKNSVSLSRTRVIDDVSSIASSEHSGKIVTANVRRRPRNNRDPSKLSLLSSFRSKTKMSSRAQTLLRDDSSYQEEEEDDLENEVFAFQDERHATVTREAMSLMESVNRSLASMGLDPPFRDMEEVSVCCGICCVCFRNCFMKAVTLNNTSNQPTAS